MIKKLLLIFIGVPVSALAALIFFSDNVKFTGPTASTKLSVVSEGTFIEYDSSLEENFKGYFDDFEITAHRMLNDDTVSQYILEKLESAQKEYTFQTLHIKTFGEYIAGMVTDTKKKKVYLDGYYVNDRVYVLKLQITSDRNPQAKTLVDEVALETIVHGADGYVYTYALQTGIKVSDDDAGIEKSYSALKKYVSTQLANELAEYTRDKKSLDAELAALRAKKEL
jgi:hypothetical protein